MCRRTLHEAQVCKKRLGGNESRVPTRKFSNWTLLRQKNIIFFNEDPNILKYSYMQYSKLAYKILAFSDEKKNIFFLKSGESLFSKIYCAKTSPTPSL